MKTWLNQTTSGFGMSISTDLAFESMFANRSPPHDPNRPLPPKVDPTAYASTYVNVATLYRNLIASIDSSGFLTASDYQLAEAISEEMEVINSLHTVEGNGLIKPVYYAMTYKKLHQGSGPTYKLRTPRTDNQRMVHSKYLSTLEKLSKHISYVEYDSVIKPTARTTSVILTHVPYDLLSYTEFNKLDLLESNTGKLKTKRDWNTKYYPVGDSDLSRLPFNRKLLLLLGDRVLVQPVDIKLRRLILTIAEKRKWTQATTNDKMMYDFNLDVKEPYVLQYIQKL
jgi:hypothetical protein